MIFKNSRYAKVDIYTVTDAQGNQHQALKIRMVPATPSFFQHTVTNNDRLDLLAFQFYGKADRFWRICDANNAMQPEELLEPGRLVNIPPDQPA